MLSSLLVVLLVETSHQFLEDRAHAMVVEAGMPDGTVGVFHRVGAQVDVGGRQLLDQGAQGVGPGEPRNLVAELEVLKDILHIGREPLQVGLEIGGELLAAGAGLQIAQGEPGGVVEGLSRCLAEGGVLFDHADLVQRCFHVQHGLLAVFQHRIQPPQDGHGKDDVTVLATNVKVAEDIVGDAPNVVGNPVKITATHMIKEFPS